ncbi:MAG: arylsulfatase [Eubacterium sp.]|nr:arylsulfatase [Eubacterium sp.]
MKHPNIIFMLLDDLGYGDVACFNPKSKIPTPNMDKLAAQGLKMTDCHASSAVCSPSRYALLTGRYNWRSRLKKTVLAGTAPHLIEDGRLTIAALLKKAGYRTAAVGKWHLGMDWQKADPKTSFADEPFHKVSTLPDWGIAYDKPILNGPTAKGFDYFFGTTASLDQPPYVFIENDMPTSHPTKVLGYDDCNHSFPDSMFKGDKGPAAEDFEFETAVPRCDQKVLDLIDEYAGPKEPFFIYYPSLAVHSPLSPAPEFKGKSELGAYGDFVMQVDHFVGRLMDKLDEKGIAEDTILIVTSDNGCSTTADIPALQSHGHYPSAQYRGAKADIWEGGHRIPFIVRWPGYVKENTECDQTVCLVDMMATFAELTEQKYPDSAGEDSVSNLDIWLGKDAPVREYTVHHSLFGNFSIRKGKWKLEMCPGSGSFNYPAEGKDTEGMPPIQLYDLENDESETTNVYDKHPEIVKELREVLRGYIMNGRSTPGEPQKNYPCENWPGLEWMLKDN